MNVVREEFRTVLSPAFKDTTFSAENIEGMLTLCIQYRPVFSMGPEELDCFTIFEAMLPLKPRTRPVDKPPYRTSPLVKEKINGQVDKLLQQGLIEKLPSTWEVP